MRSFSKVVVAGLGTSWLIGLSAQGGTTCEPGWLDTGSGSAESGPALARDSVWFDDGSGEKLYVASESGNVYRLEDSGWVFVGGQFNSTNASPYSPTAVFALEVFDADGPGGNPARLYAAGAFNFVGSRIDGTIVGTGPVAVWNGTSWAAAGTGLTANLIAPIYDLLVWDDNGTPRLVAGGGNFTIASGSSYLAVLNTATSVWESLNSNTLFAPSTEIRAMANFDGKLVVAGSFSQIDGVGNDIAYYTSVGGWGEFSSDIIAPLGTIYDLQVFNDGNGEAIYISGRLADNNDSNGMDNAVVKWNGTSYSGLGTGYVGSSHGPFLHILDTGSGPALYASGSFQDFGGNAISNLARWDNPGWSGVGYPTPGAGEIWVADTVDDQVLAFDASGMARLCNGVTSSVYPPQNAFQINGSNLKDMREWDADGAGPGASVMIGVGRYLKYGPDGPSETGEVLLHRIAQYDQNGWSSFADGLETIALATVDEFGNTVIDIAGDAVNAVEIFNGQVVVAGTFNRLGASVVANILAWDGSAWQNLGTGLQRDGSTNGVTVNELLVFDADGAGPGGAVLIAAGSFNQAGGVSVNNIAMWDGTSWSAMGAGLNNIVRALVVHDAGAGPAVYAGGQFTSPTGRVARWTGTNWVALGSGLNNTCYDLASYDADGAGSGAARLIAIGQFTTPGATIAQWSGTAWSGMGTGLTRAATFTGTNRSEKLAVVNEGSTNALIAGGLFHKAGDITSVGVARWDGTAWTGLGGGLRRSNETNNTTISCLAAWNGRANPLVLVGGAFDQTWSGVASDRFAVWGCPEPLIPPCAADFNGDSVRDVADLFAYINAWLAKTANADFNDDSAVDVADLFAYINAWLAGC